MTGPASRVLKVRRNTDQATATATPIAITFSHRVDPFTEAIWSSGTNPSRFTADCPGFYTFEAEAVWEANAAGVREIYFVKNGAGVFGFLRAPNQGAGTTVALTTMTRLFLKVGDYVETFVNQTSGGALNILFTAANESPSMSVVLERRAYDASLAHEITT